LDSAGIPPPWGRAVADPLKGSPFLYVTPKIGERWPPLLCGRGMAGLERNSSPTSVIILPNLVVIGQEYKRYLPEKSIPRVLTFDTYPSHIMTPYERSIATMGLSRTVAEINGEFSRKRKFFPLPSILFG